MQLFYQEAIEDQTPEFTFDKIESRHIVRVLRKRTGDIIHITNGKNQLFVTEILIADDKRCKVKIIKKITKKSPRNYKLTMAIAPTKSMDRLEWFLEKATEIGVDEIYFIICKHSERKVVKLERLKKIVITAMKQSLQYKLPCLHEAISFNQFISLENSGEKYIAYCENPSQKNTRHSLKSKLSPGKEYTILIGPEGDFSTEEITKALQNGFFPISLGATRLRTETAGIVAVHSVRLLNEIYEETS